METQDHYPLGDAIRPGTPREARPFVTLSYAQSLNGSITTKRGDTVALSNHESLVMTHQLRANHDAIMVGIGTALSDNPRLTVREAAGANPQPIVLDSRLRFPLDAKLLESPDINPWIITTKRADQNRRKALESAGAHVLCFPSDDLGNVDLPVLLSHLYDQGISSLMVEGGTRIISSFYQTQAIDRLIITVTPRFFGGLNAIENSPDAKLDDIPHLRHLNHQTMGTDIILFGDLQWGKS